jgi:hypothetical protein
MNVYEIEGFHTASLLFSCFDVRICIVIVMAQGEFPYLVFLVVTYPLMAALAVACFIISGPFAVWQFAHVQLEYVKKVRGCKMMGRVIDLSSSRSTDPTIFQCF